MLKLSMSMPRVYFPSHPCSASNAAALTQWRGTYTSIAWMPVVLASVVLGAVRARMGMGADGIWHGENFSAAALPHPGGGMLETPVLSAAHAMCRCSCEATSAWREDESSTASLTAVSARDRSKLI